MPEEADLTPEERIEELDIDLEKAREQVEVITNDRDMLAEQMKAMTAVEVRLKDENQLLRRNNAELAISVQTLQLTIAKAMKS